MTLVTPLLLLIGTAVALVSLVVVHLLPTGLHPLRDPVSQYGITRYRAWYRSAALGAALAGIGAAFVFATLPGVVAGITFVLLIVFAVARAFIGFFPMDAPDAPRSATGRAHNLLAFAAFASVTAASFTAGGVLHDGGATGLATWSTVCGVIMAIGTVGMLAATRAASFRRFFGLAERLIYVGFLLWFALLGVAAL